MESYRELQQSEFGAEPEGYQEADMGYFDTVSTTTSGRTSFAGSRTNTQFHDYGIVQAHERHDDGLVHNHTWAASEAFSDSSARLDDYAAVQAHERHDDGLVHGHSWAASGSFAGSKARFHDHRAVPVHEWHDEGLVHNHEWAVSGK